MATAADADPKTSTTDYNEDDTDHLYCPCDPDKGICGADVSESPDLTDVEGRERYLCVVCLDLDANYCKRCGF